MEYPNFAQFRLSDEERQKREHEEMVERIRYPYPGRPQWAKDMDAKLDEVLALLRKMNAPDSDRE